MALKAARSKPVSLHRLQRVALHTTADALAHTARRVAPPMRHVSTPSDSEADEKPPPCTVSGVPPSESTDVGEM